MFSPFYINARLYEKREREIVPYGTVCGVQSVQNVHIIS